LTVIAAMSDTSDRIDFCLGRDIGNRMAKALGIETHGVTRLVLDFPADGVAKVTVERYLGVGESDELIREITSYGLTSVLLADEEVESG
jgi:hypothetical protein